ncbi:PREDICTED: uncharacterized protein LOC105461421, partial [Wasmannia auropunctata]|uniref:uncharacterized protein LOC105461421 n=1 Tax=Wasmannia auropunctata TaxID=64793 RepID=UPI0005ED9F79
MNSVNKAMNKVCTGLPEFDISPVEPLTIDELVIYNTDSLKINLKDFKARGICDLETTSINVSPDQLQFDWDFKLKHLEIDSTYDFDMRLLVQLHNKGLMHISADNLTGKLNINLKEVTKDGKTEIYASKVKTTLNIKTFKFDFDESEKDLVYLYEAIKNTINENVNDIINIVTPVLEKKVSELMISIINKVTYNRFETEST